MDELTREFLIESQEGLDRMERCLTDLEERPQDAGLIGDIFRSVHTIKGTTGFLGFKRLEKLAHSGENLLGLLREDKLTADRPTITGLLQLLDGLRSILKTIEAEDSEGEGEDAALIERLEELQAPAQAAGKQLSGAGRTQAAQSATPSFAHSEAPAPLKLQPHWPRHPLLDSRSMSRLRRSRLPRRLPYACESRRREPSPLPARVRPRRGYRGGEHAARRCGAAEPDDEPGG